MKSLSLLLPQLVRRTLLVPLCIATVAGGVVLIPRPVHVVHVSRPARHSVAAAIASGHFQHVSGRVLFIENRTLVLRLLLGTRKVVALRRTAVTGASGTDIDLAELRRGDEVQVGGYPDGDVLAALTVQDRSRSH